MKLLTRPVTDYKRITSDLLWIDASTKLRFVVDTYYKDKNNNSRYYASEYVPDVNAAYIYLNLKYYITIECITKDDFSNDKINFIISNSNIYQFTIALENASQWFISQQHRDLFARMSDGTMKCLKDINPILVGDIFKHILSLEPGVYNDSTKNEVGVHIYIDNSDVIFMNSSSFMNFKYFIDHFNMYQTAMQMVTWLGKPVDGSNYSSTTQFSKKDMVKSNEGFLSRVNAKERIEDET